VILESHQFQLRFLIGTDEIEIAAMCSLQNLEEVISSQSISILVTPAISCPGGTLVLVKITVTNE
jgi:hypothetical protein